MCSFRVVSFLTIIGFAGTFAGIIELPSGQLRGSVIENYNSYTNIPYAEPPVRFEPSKPYETCWQGVRNGTAEMLRCVQFDGLSKASDGQEDCLFLNIFTPKRATNQKLLPVLIFIHGGAFMYGSAGSYSPKIIMDRGGMIMVSINYRLGPLGFLTTEDGIIHGNLGLKDQLLALRWIKQNIHLFGGDREKILLTGQSAGGASAHLHILRKETESLVSVAVSISGVALNPWVMQKNPKEKIKTLATHLNCLLHDLKSCLQKQPIEKVHAAVLKMFTFLDNPFNLFGPIVEGEDIPDAFITAEPRRLIERGEIANIPWMATLTTEEGAYNAGALLKKDTNGVEYIEELNERWLELAPNFFFYYDDPCAQCNEKLSQSLKEMYLGTQNFSPTTYFPLQKMFSDVLFINGILEAIKLHRMFGPSPVYGYVFGCPHNYGVGNFFSNNLEFQFGSTHGDDLVLYIPFSFHTNYTSKPNDLKISKYFIKMFEEFASEEVPHFKDTLLPENRNTLEPMQFLQIFDQNYCVGPWMSNGNQECRNQPCECFDY